MQLWKWLFRTQSLHQIDMRPALQHLLKPNDYCFSSSVPAAPLGQGEMPGGFPHIKDAGARRKF